MKCGEPRQMTFDGLQALPDKLEPGGSVKHLAVEDNWTFVDFCCLNVERVWRRKLLKKGDRWRNGEL